MTIHENLTGKKMIHFQHSNINSERENQLRQELAMGRQEGKVDEKGSKQNALANDAKRPDDKKRSEVM